MESRRSWPWKKKSSKNSGAIVSASVAASANASPANQSSRRFDEHGMSKLMADQLQEATVRFQESEEKLRALNAKLAAAEVEKENLVKQHTKVAEDAVSGWERAEEETASVKLQLETTAKKLESKISQLDSSLRESQRAAQKTREDYEKKLQELAARKNKELDRTRQELEDRLSEVGHRLLESTAETKVLASTLQERMRAISELTEAKSKAQAEIGVLGVKLESREKENLSFQYEIQVLNKQLMIRDEEKEYCKREAEIAQRQQQEGFKRIQLLESECQRLRALVKRKLPGPAAVAQMKQEVDSWGRDERRRSLGSRPENRSRDFQVQLLAERVLSMEEETKMLREVLAQKNNELAAAKSYANSECASSVRGGLKPRALLNASSPAAATGAVPGPGSISEPSVSGENASAADAWASTLLSELDSFKKQGSSDAPSPGILSGDDKFQMMDDFAEMEQLASVKIEEQKKPEESSSAAREKEEQLLAANRLCMEISSKLLATEKELAALQEKNSASEASLIKLQEKLDMIVDSDSTEKDREIQAGVHKVICLVEAIAHAIGVDHQEDGHSLPSPGVSSLSSSSGSSVSEQSNSNSNVSFEKLAIASNQVVNQGKAGLSEFIGELSAVLELIAGGFPKEFEERVDRSKEVKRLCDEVNRLKVEKELLHQSCERSGLRIGEIEVQLGNAEKMVGELREDLNGSSQYINELEERIRAADATVGDLREKLRSSEAKYQQQVKELGGRCEELEKQLASIQKSSARAKREEKSDDSNIEEAAMKLLAIGKQVNTSEKAQARSLERRSFENEKDDEFAWSRIRLHGFEAETLACWSPPKMEPGEEQFFGDNHHHHVQQQQQQQQQRSGAVDDSDSSWLYTPDQRRAVMRSPGRYLVKKSNKNELSKSVNLPVTPKIQTSGSFSRFFSRNR